MDENHEQFAQRPADGPVVRQQQLERGPLLLRRAPPEDGDGHDRGIGRLAVACGADKTLQDRQVWPPAAGRPQEHRRPRLPDSRGIDRVAGGTPAGAQALLVDDSRLADTGALEDEEDRAIAERGQHRALVLQHTRLDPDEEDPPDQSQPEAVEAHMTRIPVDAPIVAPRRGILSLRPSGTWNRSQGCLRCGHGDPRRTAKLEP